MAYNKIKGHIKGQVLKRDNGIQQDKIQVQKNNLNASNR